MVPVQSAMRNLIWKFSTLEQIIMLYDRIKAIPLGSNTGGFITGNQKFYRTQFPLLSKGRLTRSQNKIETRDGTVIRKKTNPPIMVHLSYQNQELVLPIEEAKKIAKSKKLSLVKKKDANQSSLMTFYELVEDHQLMKQLQSPGNWKNVKTYIFSSGINEHDVKVKMKLILKYLNKNERVKCVVRNLSSNQIHESIVNLVRQELSKSGISHEMKLEQSAQFVQLLIRKTE